MKKYILLSALLATFLFNTGVLAQESQFIDFGAAPLPMGERPDPTSSNPAFTEEGDETIVEKPEAPPKPRVSKLYMAVARNDLVAVREACEAGCNIQENFYKNNNILHLAATAGNLGIYQYAWDKGANYNVNLDKETPLHFAAQSGNVELVDYILSKIKDPQKAMASQNKDNQTPLFYAFRTMASRDLTGLYLLARQADCNAKDKAGQTPMTWAMLQKNQRSIAQFQKYGCNFFIADKDGLTPAHMAVRQAVLPQDFQEYNKFLYSGITVADTEVGKTVEIQEPVENEKPVKKLRSKALKTQPKLSEDNN